MGAQVSSGNAPHQALTTNELKPQRGTKTSEQLAAPGKTKDKQDSTTSLRLPWNTTTYPIRC